MCINYKGEREKRREEKRKEKSTYLRSILRPWQLI